MLTVAERKGAVISDNLRQLWEGDRVRILNRKATRLDGAYMSLIGHITADEAPGQDDRPRSRERLRQSHPLGLRSEVEVDPLGQANPQLGPRASCAEGKSARSSALVAYGKWPGREQPSNDGSGCTSPWPKCSFPECSVP